MAKDMLDAIYAAEEACRQRESEAKAKAEQSVAAARKEAEALIAARTRKAEEDAEAALAAAQANSEARLRQAKADAEAECRKIAADAAKALARLFGGVYLHQRAVLQMLQQAFSVLPQGDNPHGFHFTFCQWASPTFLVIGLS